MHRSPRRPPNSASNRSGRVTNPQAAIAIALPPARSRSICSRSRKVRTDSRNTGARMREIAERRYRWAEIGAAYFACSIPRAPGSKRPRRRTKPAGNRAA
ncbi:hypothetical protein CCR90_05170 [Rhodovulum sulfidophilum]|nr:hypothetical protein [Rhodovulum sulfidophilum]